MVNAFPHSLRSPLFVMLIVLSGPAVFAQVIPSIVHLPYDGSDASFFSVDVDTRVSFEVDGVPQYCSTRWYVDGVHRETDESGFFGFDPQYTWTFTEGVEVQARLFINGRQTQTKTWHVTVRFPDLTVTDMTVIPDTVQPGGTIRIDAWVKNIGLGADAARSTIAFDWFDGFDSTPIAQGFIPNIGPLRPGVEVQETVFSYTVPTEPGIYEVIATADWYKEVEETSESNNTIKVPVVIPGSRGVPDFLGRHANDVTPNFRTRYDMRLTIIADPTSTGPQGVIVYQSLAAGASVPVNSAITLKYSLGRIPSITINTPKRREVIGIGDKRRIKWTSEYVSGMVRIELWQDGSKVRDIVDETENDGKFPWKVRRRDYQPGKKYAVKIVSTENETIADFSPGSFSIVAQ